MAITISLAKTAAIVENLASRLQAEALKVRRRLFYDKERGFNHNMGGVRTDSSVKDAEAYVNNVSGNLVRFKFRSHRMLWFTIDGVSKRYILATTNQYDYKTPESNDANPYLKIEQELKKAASELRIMEQAYSELLNAA